MSPRPALPLRLEYAILGLIRRQPMHGYQLLQRWKEAGSVGIVWRIQPGSLYAALDRLEQMELLSSAPAAADATARRKVYQVSPAGEQAFLAWMRTPVKAARDLRQDFLAKLFFSKDVAPALFEELLSQQRSICRNWLDSLEAQREAASGFERRVLDFRARQVLSILEWLHELTSEINLDPQSRLHAEGRAADKS